MTATTDGTTARELKTPACSRTIGGHGPRDRPRSDAIAATDEATTVELRASITSGDKAVSQSQTEAHPTDTIAENRPSIKESCQEVGRVVGNVVEVTNDKSTCQKESEEF